MPMAKRRPGGYEVDRTATTRMMSQHRLSCRVPNIAFFPRSVAAFFSFAPAYDVSGRLSLICNIENSLAAGKARIEAGRGARGRPELKNNMHVLRFSKKTNGVVMEKDIYFKY
ncbi:hypothetical protein F4824DRAFT_500963 [Ustulina deusta]|nr:hypothetical protein F4824DRAFT_500963 [Ustulina deusta]